MKITNASSFRRTCGEMSSNVTEDVQKIISEVRGKGDAAVKFFTNKFDQVSLDNLLCSNWDDISTVAHETQEAIQKAYQNILQFHQLQKPSDYSISERGVNLWREYRPLKTIGLYVPGGTAPLISTLLMMAIPAKIAGCQRVIMTTPPDKNGKIHPGILFVAQLCGVTEVYSCGGAQAIAAMAYGTETIPKVTKILGPGNKYVTEAKIQVSQDPAGCAIDLPAGPSEVLVIADNDANPEFIASDLLAQAEHDGDSRAILLTCDRTFSEKVQAALKKQLAVLSRQTILDRSVKEMSLVICHDMDECIRISNEYAPEHLILNVANPKQYVSSITNAGSVFIGPWSAEALGDYASGPNHVLPTSGYAKSHSGLTVEHFMKSMTFQEIMPEGLLDLADCVEHLALVEGLDAHRNAVSIRREYLERKTS